MYNLNFHQLRLFYEVAQMGSFSKAAEELDISQPAVSSQIREFEISLDLRLFERSGKGLMLTDAGRIAHRYAQQIFNLAGEMERSINDLKGLTSGSLSLASSTTVGECVLPEIMGRFKSEYPGIALELQITNTEKVVDRVIERNIDLGFVGEEVTEPELLVIPFHTDEIVVFGAADHPLADRANITAADLAEVPFVMREHGSATRHTAEKSLTALGIKPVTAMELGTNEAVKRAVAAGLGLGMLSNCSIQPDLKAGLVKVIPVEGWQCSRNFTVVYRKDRELTRAEKGFIAIVTGNEK